MSDDSSNQSFPFKFSFKLLVYKSYIKLSSLRRWQARRKQALKKTKALKEKDGKNEIRFSKTGFPILMIFQGACLQKLHQTKRHWKWKIGRKEDKSKLPIYIFFELLVYKRYTKLNSQRRWQVCLKQAWNSDKRGYHLSANADDWSWKIQFFWKKSSDAQSLHPSPSVTK